MDTLLTRVINAPGISGYESGIASIMIEELSKSCGSARADTFGNVIASKGSGAIKIMLATLFRHMAGSEVF